jgi:hypothetical protein
MAVPLAAGVVVGVGAWVGVPWAEQIEQKSKIKKAESPMSFMLCTLANTWREFEKRETAKRRCLEGGIDDK